MQNESGSATCPLVTSALSSRRPTRPMTCAATRRWPRSAGSGAACRSRLLASALPPEPAACHRDGKKNAASSSVSRARGFAEHGRGPAGRGLYGGEPESLGRATARRRPPRRVEAGERLVGDEAGQHARGPRPGASIRARTESAAERYASSSSAPARTRRGAGVASSQRIRVEQGLHVLVRADPAGVHEIALAGEEADRALPLDRMPQRTRPEHRIGRLGDDCDDASGDPEAGASSFRDACETVNIRARRRTASRCFNVQELAPRRWAASARGSVGDRS